MPKVKPTAKPIGDQRRASSQPVPWETLGGTIEQANFAEWVAKQERRTPEEKRAKLTEVEAEVDKQEQAQALGDTTDEKLASKLAKLAAQRAWLQENADVPAKEKPAAKEKEPESESTSKKKRSGSVLGVFSRRGSTAAGDAEQLLPKSVAAGRRATATAAAKGPPAARRGSSGPPSAVPWEDLGGAVEQADLKAWRAKWGKKGAAEKAAKAKALAAEVAKVEEAIAAMTGDASDDAADKMSAKLRKLHAQLEFLDGLDGGLAAGATAVADGAPAEDLDSQILRAYGSVADGAAGSPGGTGNQAASQSGGESSPEAAELAALRDLGIGASGRWAGSPLSFRDGGGASQRSQRAKGASASPSPTKSPTKVTTDVLAAVPAVAEEPPPPPPSPPAAAEPLIDFAEPPAAAPEPVAAAAPDVAEPPAAAPEPLAAPAAEPPAPAPAPM